MRAFTARADFAAPVIVETCDGQVERKFQDNHFANMLTHVAQVIARKDFVDEYEQDLLQARLMRDVHQLQEGRN